MVTSGHCANVMFNTTGGTELENIVLGFVGSFCAPHFSFFFFRLRFSLRGIFGDLRLALAEMSSSTDLFRCYKVGPPPKKSLGPFVSGEFKKL
jgi:hypothetical protein